LIYLKCAICGSGCAIRVCVYACSLTVTLRIYVVLKGVKFELHFKTKFIWTFFSKRPDRLGGPPILLCTGYRCSFPGVKRPGPEGKHSPPYSAEVIYVCMAWTGRTILFTFHSIMDSLYGFL
jgi:hypothetical protein